MYIYITHLKARSKTARYERDSLKSSHARHLPVSNYMIICTVIYLYTHSIHIRTLTDKAHTETGYTHRQVTHRRLKAISHRSRPARAILSCEKFVLLSWRVREHSSGQKMKVLSARAGKATALENSPKDGLLNTHLFSLFSVTGTVTHREPSTG